MLRASAVVFIGIDLHRSIGRDRGADAVCPGARLAPVGSFHIISLPHHFQRVAVSDRLENNPARSRDRDHERSVPDRYIELIQDRHAAVQELFVLPLKLCQFRLLQLIGNTFLPRIDMQRRAPLPGGQNDRPYPVIALIKAMLYKTSPCVLQVLIINSCRTPGHIAPLSGASARSERRRSADSSSFCHTQSCNSMIPYNCLPGRQVSLEAGMTAQKRQSLFRQCGTVPARTQSGPCPSHRDAVPPRLPAQGGSSRSGS